jgi:hypothetical protein
MKGKRKVYCFSLGCRLGRNGKESRDGLLLAAEIINYKEAT